MSQSDYIQRIKTSTKLAGISKIPINRNDFPQVLSSQDYIDFSQYQITNTIVSTKITPNELVAPNHKIVFNMDVSSTNNCPTFAVCTNTNTRQNRKLNGGFIMYNMLPLVTPVTHYKKQGDTICGKKQVCTSINQLRTAIN